MSVVVGRLVRYRIDSSIEIHLYYKLGIQENNQNISICGKSSPEFSLRFSTTGGYGEFVYELEQVFYNLVQECMSCGLKQQHKFKSMNATRRQIIHELAEFYGLETQAFDEEPHRHVVAYAYRSVEFIC